MFVEFQLPEGLTYRSGDYLAMYVCASWSSPKYSSIFSVFRLTLKGTCVGHSLVLVFLPIKR